MTQEDGNNTAKITPPFVGKSKKHNWLILGIVCIIVFGGTFVYILKERQVKKAFCSLQNMTYVYSCGSMGCSYSSGKCMPTAVDYLQSCTRNTECSSGLCVPPYINTQEIPIKPTIEELISRNPNFVTGTCYKVKVSQNCTENSGLSTQVAIQKLANAYQVYENSPKKIVDRMNLDTFFGPINSGDMYGCGSFD